MSYLKKYSSFFVVAMCFLSSTATEYKILSPDSKLQVVVSDHGGRPSYAITYAGSVFLKESPLGLNTHLGDYPTSVFMNSEPSRTDIAETYELPDINLLQVHYRATKRLFTFKKKVKPDYDTIFPLNNRDVAFWDKH